MLPHWWSEVVVAHLWRRKVALCPGTARELVFGRVSLEPSTLCPWSSATIGVISAQALGIMLHGCLFLKSHYKSSPFFPPQPTQGLVWILQVVLVPLMERREDVSMAWPITGKRCLGWAWGCFWERSALGMILSFCRYILLSGLRSWENGGVCRPRLPSDLLPLLG